MRMRPLGVLALFVITLLPACATTHGARWAYGKSSTYDAPDEVSEGLALRALVGVPVIVGGVVWDAATWPLQLLFGVWPLWGNESTMMNPDTH
jgi:hypothetical protein